MSYATAEIVDLNAYRVTQRPRQDHFYGSADLTMPAPYWLWAPVFIPAMWLAPVADGSGRDWF